MVNYLGTLIFDVIATLGFVTGLGALIAYICRMRLSRILGMISVGSFFILLLWIWFESPGIAPLFLIVFLLFATPGLIGIFCTRAPRTKPGHCTKCGYNLTGNVSGKCPECGEKVLAPLKSHADPSAPGPSA